MADCVKAEAGRKRKEINRLLLLMRSVVNNPPAAGHLVSIKNMQILELIPVSALFMYSSVLRSTKQSGSRRKQSSQFSSCPVSIVVSMSVFYAIDHWFESQSIHGLFFTSPTFYPQHRI